MTVFDIALLLVILVSALVGYARGAIKELVTLFAFLAAAVAAVAALPLSGKLFRSFVHPAWAGNAAALLVVFVAAYVLVRVVGSSLTRHVQDSRLGGLDRAAGAAFGIGRALVLAGAFFLVFNRITPADLAPRWITGALTWPLARRSGDALASFAPSGLHMADGLTRMMGEGVRKGFDASHDQEAEGDASDGPVGAADDSAQPAPRGSRSGDGVSTSAGEAARVPAARRRPESSRP